MVKNFKFEEKSTENLKQLNTFNKKKTKKDNISIEKNQERDSSSEKIDDSIILNEFMPINKYDD